MTATLIPTATEAEWLEARRQGITASEVAVLMGLSPYSSPYALYHQKLGNLPEQDETDAMALGKHMESFVAAKFAGRHPEFYVCGDGRQLYAHHDRRWQMATPDRLLTEVTCRDCSEPDCPWGHLPVAVLECKIDGGSDGWGEDGSDEIPVHYRCQVLWQMDVMGVETAYVACLLWNRRQVRIYEISLLDEDAQADLDLMRDEADLFRARLTLFDPPDVDWRPATTDALKRLHPSLEDRDAVVRARTANAYRAAVRRYKTAGQRKDEMANRLRAEMGSAQRAVTSRGDPVATRQVYEVAAHRRKASVTDKLVPAKAPKEPSA